MDYRYSNVCALHTTILQKPCSAYWSIYNYPKLLLSLACFGTAERLKIKTHSNIKHNSIGFDSILSHQLVLHKLFQDWYSAT